MKASEARALVEALREARAVSDYAKQVEDVYAAIDEAAQECLCEIQFDDLLPAVKQKLEADEYTIVESSRRKFSTISWATTEVGDGPSVLGALVLPPTATRARAARP